MGEPGSWGVGESGSRGVGEPGSRGVGESGSRGVGESGSREVGESGSWGVGESGRTPRGPATRNRGSKGDERGFETPKPQTPSEKGGRPKHHVPSPSPATRRHAIQQAAERLAAAGIEVPRRQAEWLLEAVLGCTRVQVLTTGAVPLEPAQAAAFASLVERRLAGEPVQYLIGHTDFFGLRLRVTPAVLIPRPETEQVVEAALARIAPVDQPAVLDIGTGSGAMALATQQQRPSARVVGCDVSADALAVAQENATALGLAVTFCEADVLATDFPAQVPGPFDLVLSNPPYIPEAEAPTLAAEVRDHEPHRALFAGKDALRFYRAIARHARQLLTPGGWLVFETHADYGAEVAAHLRETGWRAVSLHTDLAGLPRIVQAQHRPAA